MATLIPESGAFIGRRDVLDDLLARRKAAGLRRGSLVLVSGEAGIGKTRLLEEFAAGLSHGRGRVRWVHCAASDAGDLADVAAEEGAERRVTALLIDDAHLAPAALLERLHALGKAAPQTRLLVVVAFRPGEIVSDEMRTVLLGRLARLPGARSFELEPLDASEAAALLGALGEERGAFDATSLHELVRRAAGNPLLLRELYAHAVTNQAKPAGSLPLALRGFVAEWLREFSEAERDVLRHAALAERCSVLEVAALLGLPEDVVAAALQRARGIGLVSEDRNSATYAFRHPVVAEALHANFLAHEKRALHARIARAIEDAGDANARAGELAQHWEAAANASLASSYAERAGDRAAQSGAHAEAARWYERAANLARQNESPPHYVYEKLALALLRAGRPQDSHVALRAAISGFEAAGDRERAIRLRLHDALSAQYESDLAAGLSRLESATSHALPPDSQRYAQVVAAYLLAQRQETERALALVADFPLDDPSLDPGALAKYWDVIAYVATQRCDAATFEAACERSLEVARRRGDPAYVANVEVDRAVASMHVAYPAAVERFERAIALAQEHGLAGSGVYARAFCALNAFVREQLVAARSDLRAMLPTAQDMPMTLVARSFAGIGVARALCDEELLAQCARAEIVETAFATQSGSVFGRIAGPYAEWLIESSRGDEARAVLHRCVDGLRSAYGAFLTLPVVAEHGDGGDVVAARRLLETSAANPNDAIARATLGLFDSLWNARIGRSEESAAAAAGAGEAYRAIGWSTLEARALELAGEMPRALALYGASGNVRELRRLEFAGPAREPEQAQAGEQILSTKERDIASLVVAGKSNRAIASALAVSEKTVERHLTSIFEKLGFRSRTELTASVIGHALLRTNKSRA